MYKSAIFITAVISLALVAAGIYLVTKFQLWFEKHRLKLLTLFVILGIIIYTIGYLSRYDSNYITSGLMAIFSTGRMFVFENDISSFESDLTSTPFYNIYILIFGLIMTFSMLTTGMIILSFLGYRLLCRIRLSFMCFIYRNRKIYIFAGITGKGLQLADDIKSKHKKNIIVFCTDIINGSEEDEKLEREVGRKNYLIYSVKHEDDIIQLCKRLYTRNKILIFAMNEENKNIAFIHKFAQYSKALKNINDNISIYASVNIYEYDDLLYNQMFEGLDIHIIDENDLAARHLFNQLNLLQCEDDTKLLTICIIGFTSVTEDIYRNVIFMGQSDGIRLKLILIDTDISKDTAIFFHKNPELFKCANISCLDIQPNTSEFYKYIEDNIENINCFIITDENIHTATEISRSCRNFKAKASICINISEYSKYSYLFKTNLLEQVIVYGSNESIFTGDIIVGETLDRLAKGFNSYYMQLYPGSKPWEEISIFEKQSNRALAMHIQTKLYSIGLKLVEGGDISLYEERIKDKNVLEFLAKGEHLRWNAFYFANGWRTMKDINNDRNKDLKAKTHSCLVDWGELDMVSERFGKDFKELDRHLVRNIGNVIKSVGLGVEAID